VRLSCSESYSYIHNIKTDIMVLIIGNYFIIHELLLLLTADGM